MTWFEILSIFASTVGVLGSALIAVLCFQMRRTLDTIDGHGEKMMRLDKALDEHKLYSANTYAKDAEFKASTKEISISINSLRDAVNTNTNMTGVILEKITSVNEKVNSK